MGVFDFVPFAITRGSSRQRLDYDERTLLITASQLLSDEWSVGVRYRLSQAELDSRYPEVTSSANTGGGFDPSLEVESVLHQVQLYALYHHPGGFFAEAGALWNSQSNHGYDPARPGDTFWQLNLHAGYRFFHRRAEVRLGLLNLTDQDYRLNPLNLTPELPRERTFVASLRFSF